ncbi:MAG TPA: FecR domain-containing protein [Rhizomicrobium sp.]
MIDPRDEDLEVETGAGAIWAQAADWLMERRASDSWDAADQTALDAWLGESSDHLVAYWRLEAAWDRTYRLAALRTPAIERLSQKIPKPAITKIVSAVIAVLALAGFSTFHFLQPASQTFATATGGHRIVRLADGSSVELNTDTALHIAMSAGERSIVLEKGEAYFQIKHDAARPFIVTAGNHRITDLGTAFVIRRSDENLRVALLEGRAQIDAVGLQTSSSSAMLSPGDVAIATADTLAVRRMPKAQLADGLAWRRGLLVFNNTPLATVVAELNRYNETKLAVADSQTAKIGIGGKFPTNDTAAFIRVAHELLGLQTVRRGDTIIITR